MIRHLKVEASDGFLELPGSNFDSLSSFYLLEFIVLPFDADLLEGFGKKERSVGGGLCCTDL